MSTDSIPGGEYPAHSGPAMRPSIRKSLLTLIFSGSYMKRWNDKLRPMELYEVDKQAHKMMAAWMLFMRASEGRPEEERLALAEGIVEGGLFEYLYRLVITDIKPPVFYQIKANAEHYQRLSEWVLQELSPRIQSLGPEFTGRFRAYIARPEPPEGPEGEAGRILAAAHVFASSYEFSIIKDQNPMDEDLPEIEDDFRRMLEEHKSLPGLPELVDPSTPLGRLAGLCGRLRFQTRWSQTPRVPETSVLGHMFVVAAYAYFFSLEIGACRARRVNNFFSGLFHDLPELLTRDIISPVKRSVEGLLDLIHEYEDEALERRVFEPLEQGGLNDLAARLRFYLGFGLGPDAPAHANTALVDGEMRAVSFQELSAQYNQDALDPRDGNLVKLCDDLAAFIEAYTAVRNGVASEQLHQSLWRMRLNYQKETYRNGVHIGALVADFD